MQTLQELLDEIDASIELDKVEQPFLDKLDRDIAASKPRQQAPVNPSPPLLK